MLFNLVKRTDVSEAFRVIAMANGLNPDEYLDNARKAGDTKMAESRAKREEYSRLMNAANTARTAGQEKANSILDAALSKCDVDTSDLRFKAESLADAVKHLNKKHWLSKKTDSSVDTLIKYLGKDLSVFDEMIEAANKANDEADSMEAEAKEAMAEANRLADEAANTAEQKFAADIAAASPLVTEAKKYEELAKAYFRGADFFSA